MCLCDSGVCGDNVGVQSLFSKPMTQHKLISVPMTFQLHHCSTDSNRLPALHRPSMCWCTCVGHSCSTISSWRRKVFISSVPFVRHHVMHPLLSKRSTPHQTCRGSTVSSACLPRHRRLRVRATVRMMPISIRKGSQVFRKPAQLDEVERRQEDEEEEKSMEVVMCKKETRKTRHQSSLTLQLL